MTPRPWEPEAVAQRRAERRQRTALLIVAGTTVIAVLLAVVVAIVSGDDDPGVQAGATTLDSTPNSTVGRTSTTARRSTTTVGRSTTTSRAGSSSSSGPAASTPTPGATTVAGPTSVGAPTSVGVPTSAPTPTPAPPTVNESTTSSTTATPTPTAVPGTIANPVQLGTTAPIGEGWDLNVIAYVPDSTKEVLAEDELNEPPDDGFQYALASVEVTYNGTDPTTSMFDVDVGVIDPSGVETDMFSCPVIVPNELDTSTEVSPGTTVTGNLCFMLPIAGATNVVMYATAGFVNDDIYFALT